MGKLIVVGPEACERGGRHHKESTWAEAPLDLTEGGFLSRYMLQDIQEEDHIPFLVPGKVQQIDLVPGRVGSNHGFRQG